MNVVTYREPLRAAHGSDDPAYVIVTPRVMRWFYRMTAAVTGLAVLREIVLALAGSDTILRDLRHFNLDAERNLGSWYSSGLMILIALCALSLAMLWQRRKYGHAMAWIVISAVFVALSLDETVGFHEVIDVPLREKFGLTGFLYNPWALAGGAFAAAFAVYMIPFLLALPRRLALFFVAAGAIYVSGAVGLEFVDGWAEYSFGEGNALQMFSTLIEETAEMLGLTIFLHGLTLQMRAEQISIHTLWGMRP